MSASPHPSTRRRFLRHCAIGGAALASLSASRTLAAAPSSPRPRPRLLTLRHTTLPDPDGHHAALRLKGDWLLVGIGDDQHVGLGEISHNGDDPACLRRVRELFEAHIAGAPGGFELNLAAITALDGGVFATAPDFITATAISGLNQALLDLVAQRAGVPVWRLFRPEGAPVRAEVPCYFTLNRVLRARAIPDFLRAVESARALGVEAIKLTPFEAVTRDGDQLAQAAEGFARLAAVRKEFPRLSLRVDCHERFTPAAAAALLPRFAALGLDWLEEPCPPGPALGNLRAQSKLPLAVGELFFGEDRFRELLESGWADVIMPDPKHVGGFSALVRVCRMAEKLSGQVSPHNPSGPVAACAALQTAALSPAVTSVELIFTSDPARQPGRELLQGGNLRLPDAPGWGLPGKIRDLLRSGSYPWYRVVRNRF